MRQTSEAPHQHLRAAGTLYNAYFTGLILTLNSRRKTADAADWVFRVFRHQHHQKFLSSFEKLGLADLPDAVACAAYHYLSNRVGGVTVEFMRESDRKAWVYFRPPRWIYPGAAICGVPGAISRAMLRGWYAQNGVSLKNPRLGFVCTAQTVEGQYGLAGYFQEHDHDLEPDERLRFSPGEIPPPFDPDAAPALPGGEWPEDRLVKARRNYAMEYVRSGLPRMAEMFGPSDAAALGNLCGRLIGAQFYQELADAFDVTGDDPGDFARWMARLARAEGDEVEITQEDDAALLRRSNWRLMRGIEGPQSPAVFDAWNGLLEGALMVHNRTLALEVLRRLDYGDDAFEWRIRPLPRLGR